VTYEISHIAPELSDEQRANLATLAAYLRTLPVDYPDFEMEQYVQGSKGYGGSLAHVPECGTAACAAGHGPAAGVLPLQGENWHKYSCRAFCPAHTAEWDWCFSASWSNVDNTAHGAAARIEWLLTKGLPANAVEQCFGGDPLCYAKGAA